MCIRDRSPRGAQNADPKRRVDHLIDSVPRDIRKVYKMRPIIESVVDQGSFFEMGRQFGKSVITGFARLDGWPVAIMASDPYSYGGCWTAATCKKVMKFVDMATRLLFDNTLNFHSFGPASGIPAQPQAGLPRLSS